MHTLPGSRSPAGEPPYAPSKWNDSSGLFTHNCYSYALNDLHKGPRKFGKPQPGWYRKLTNGTGGPNYKLSCSDIEKGVKADNPKTLRFFSIKKGEKFVPPPYHYKAFLMVSPGNDFHFARQDNRMLKVYNVLKKSDLYLPSKTFISKVLLISKKLVPEIYSLIPSTLKTQNKKLKFMFENSKTWSHKPGSGKVTDKDSDSKLIFNPLKANWNYGSINYNQPCKFFTVPMNTKSETFSTGSPGFLDSNKSPPAEGLTRLDVSATPKEQLFDQKVQNLLRRQSRS
jgi:hypothetical protein